MNNDEVTFQQQMDITKIHKEKRHEHANVALNDYQEPNIIEEQINGQENFHKQRMERNLKKQAKRLGFQIVPCQ